MQLYSGEELQSGNTKAVEVQCDTAEGKFPESWGELAVVNLTFSQSEAVADRSLNATPPSSTPANDDIHVTVLLPSTQSVSTCTLRCTLSEHVESRESAGPD